MRIFLFSRPIRSGKTTELLRLKERNTSLTGIAMPDASTGRLMIDLTTGNAWQAQCPETLPAQAPVETVGRFSFYTTAFQMANTLLIHQAARQPEWLAIDEIGKLELNQQGFFPALTQILATASPTNLLLVVRDSLLANVIAAFEFSQPEIIHRLDDRLNQ